MILKSLLRREYQVASSHHPQFAGYYVTHTHQTFVAVADSAIMGTSGKLPRSVDNSR